MRKRHLDRLRTRANPRAALVVAMVVLALLASGCAHWPWNLAAHNPLARWVPSPNHNARRAILIVLHATEQDSVEQSLHTLRTGNSGGPVSSHYLIGRDGRRYQLVRDNRRAWHAGPGRWGTITDVNSASIGIELDNNGRDAFSEAQVQSLLVLLEDLCKRLDIPRTQVIGHADMAPTRKKDPGVLFPWARLAAAGFGRWPASPTGPVPTGFDATAALQSLGYPMADPAAAIVAFHRHFRGIESSETVLDEEDRQILFALIGK